MVGRGRVRLPQRRKSSADFVEDCTDPVAQPRFAGGKFPPRSARKPPFFSFQRIKISRRQNQDARFIPKTTGPSGGFKFKFKNAIEPVGRLTTGRQAGRR